LKLAIEFKRQKINDSYHGVKKTYHFDSPDVYLIRHQLNNINGIEIDSYNLLKIEKSKTKESPLGNKLNEDPQGSKEGSKVDVDVEIGPDSPSTDQTVQEPTKLKPYLFFYKSPDGYFYPIYINESSKKKRSVLLTDKTLYNEINYLIKYNESVSKK